MIATAPVHPIQAPAIARLGPLALGLALAASLSVLGAHVSLPASSMEGAAEGPSTSCVGCHTAEVPEGAPQADPGATPTAMRRQAECRR